MDAAAITITKELGYFGHPPAAVADLQPDGDPTIGLVGGKLVDRFGQGLGYKEFLGKPLGALSHELHHTSYRRSGDC